MKTTLEQKYDFAIDMIITFGKLLGQDESREDVDKRIELLLENFDVDTENEVLINKRSRH